MLTHLKLGHGGRLCNQMFQISAILGLARKYGHDFAFPYWMNYEHRNRFGSIEDIDIQSWFKNKLPVLESGEGFEDFIIEFNADPYNDFSRLQLRNQQNFNITQQYSGHLQSEKWFAHCKDVIRHYFEFDQLKIHEEYRNVGRTKNRPAWIITPPWMHDNSCGIHVRIGDYAKADSMQPVLSYSYYAEAMVSMLPGTKFFVFSDEPEKAKELLRGLATNCTFITGSHYMLDLYLMTQCKNFIIANSTFSWWGAWLINNKDKRIVAPSTWWTPRAVAEWNYSTKNLYPEDWTII